MTTVWLMIFTYCLNSNPITCEVATNKMIFISKSECSMAAEKYLIPPKCTKTYIEKD